MAYTDQELLAIVGDEKRRSVGFNLNANSSELIGDREQALNYIKGDMTADIPSLPNRSAVVSTDVADTIETWLSDMVEILCGPEDVVAFRATSSKDEEQARQETDYVNHVFFNENPGFMNLYTMLKDAAETKTGILTWWKEDVPKPEPTQYEGLDQAQLALIAQGDDFDEELTSVRPSKQQGPFVPDPQTGQLTPMPLFDVTIEARQRQRVKIAAVSPSDFSVAADTVNLADATYCAMRSRPRAQDLLADGVDPDVVDDLPAYSGTNDSEEQSRDTAGEHSSGASQGGVGDLRQVQIIKHYIRLVDIPSNKTKIWCVRTSNDDALLIDKEEVDEVPFGAITPYPVTHRFYGRSIADKTVEIQKIKTSLTRVALDNAYFAQNQRYQVSEDDSSENTIPDLLRNEPGMPVRSKTGTAVTALTTAQLGFDPLAMLEYASTMAEARTGVVRNAQGLNPDTLHDTASGAGMLAAAAQKRSKLMARIFAETGIKDVYLGVHAMSRRIGGMTDTIRLLGNWVDIDPTKFGERKDMDIVVGGGASERGQEMAMIGAVIEKQSQVVEQQAGLDGPLVTAPNAYASLIQFTKKAGVKNAESYFTNPATIPPKPPAPPSAEDMKAKSDADQGQARLELDHQKLGLDAKKLQIDEAKVSNTGQVDQAKIQLDQAKIQMDQDRIKLDFARLQLEERERDRAHQLELLKITSGANHNRDKLDSENALRMLELNAKYKTSIDVAQVKSAAEQFRAQADVTMQAAEHAHDHALAQMEHGHALLENVTDHIVGAAVRPDPVVDESEEDEVENDEGDPQ